MEFKVIAFDIDGTLTVSKSPLEDNPQVSDDMSDLLRELLKKYTVAIISGASFKQFDSQILSHLSKDHELLKNLFLLPTNGTTICTYNDGAWQCPPVNALTEEEKKKIFEAFDKTFQEVGFQIPENLYGDLLEDRGSQVTFSAFGQKAPIEVKESWDKDHAKREKMLHVLEKYLPDFASHIGGTTSIDVTRKGIDKAYGLTELLKKLNLSRENLLYVGDELFPGGNDEPATRVAGECRSVSGPEETKKLIKNLLN